MMNGNNKRTPEPVEYGIGWMPEGAVRREEKRGLFDRIYRTPAVIVAALFSGAAVAVSIVAFLLALILGLRIYTDVDASGNELRYFGFMRGGEATFGTIYTPDGEQGRVRGNRVKFSDGSLYEGSLDGLIFEGDGSFTDADGNVFKGKFKKGLLEGEGVIEYADGSVFRGSFVGGKRDGYGEYVGADGSSYKGYYAEGEKSGFGELIYADGSVYKGYFMDGMRHGEGSYRFASGDAYTGEFRNNVISGHGSYFFASGRVFTGEFKNGVPVVE